VLIRGVVYLVRVPFISEDTTVKLTDFVEDLPQDIAIALTAEEFEILARKMSGAARNLHSLYNLTIDDTFLDDVERGLVWRGVSDLENAAYTLKHSGDTQNSIFQTHAASEKFLKAALKRSDSKVDLQSLGHNLPRVFERLVAANSRYDWLRSSVEALQKFAPNMQIRYGIVPRTVENALVGFNAALSICGASAQLWLFDFARGTERSDFAVGRFYLDGSKSTFYCKQILCAPGNKRSAVLTRFDVNTLLGATMIDMVVEMKYSGLYLEVKDARQLEDLRRRLGHQLRNPGRLVRAEDLGIQITAGPEGSYTTGHVRVRIRPEK